ncbi:acyl carrier protein [Streptomyces sp. NPDC005148]
MSTQDVEAVGSRETVEKKVTAIWESQLDLQGIGPDEDFFDLGGHSLHAVEIISRLEHAFGVAVPLRDFYRTPTTAGVAAIVVSMTGPGPQPTPTRHLPT